MSMLSAIVVFQYKEDSVNRNHVLFVLLLAFVLAACGQQPSTPSTTLPVPQPTVQPQPAKAATSTPTPAPKPTSVPTATSVPILSVQIDAPPKPIKPAHRAPRRIVIEDISLDYNPVAVGLDKHKAPIVPDHDVGWYTLSAGPGEGENIVLWGHVLRFTAAPKIPAPFAHLKELQIGAAIVLYDFDGSPHNYVVRQQIWVTPDQVQWILPQGHEMVTLVSCIGDNVISDDGHVADKEHRLITIAEPA